MSRKAGYVSFCRNETGRLLATLAATRGGTLAEFGTGCGVGTAWLRSGVRNGAHILTAELDPEAGRRRRRDLRGRPPGRGARRRLVDAADKGPFSLLFLDSGEPESGPRRRHRGPPRAGRRSWSSTTSPRASRGRPIYHGRVDTLREEWLTDERFTAVEVMIAPDASALIATRR